MSTAEEAVAGGAGARAPGVVGPRCERCGRAAGRVGRCRRCAPPRGIDRGRVAELMAGLAAGDGRDLKAFVDEVGPILRAVVRRVLAERGVAAPSRQDLDDLMWDAALALQSCAGSWRPDGGALPWVWARHRLVNVVDDFLGIWADPLDDHQIEEVAATVASLGDDRPVTEVLDRVAADGVEEARLLRDGLARVASERDRTIFLEVAVAVAEGCPAPAASVAAHHGLTPEAVRQVRSRVRRRLLGLASGHPAFAPLASLALVA